MSSVVVVFPKLEDAKSIRNLLVRSGIEVAGVCTTGGQALDVMDSLGSGIIVCGYRFRDMLYTELKEQMGGGFEMLLLASQRVLAEKGPDDVMAVRMPLKVHELLETIHMMQYAQEKQKKKKRPRSTREKAVIEKAKAFLMERNHMTEEEAHRYVQKCSMDSGNSMVETAQMIISLERV
ncbi:MAG: ANTAR domain-containing protein [Lachnospiraceae bacterium]|jgi:AmiR/NasT family two-component response regulator|nr:ANTAR domain-containing protein [Lachnospiraceae bacterium]MCI9390311.1 ANTAR domain-containing protein [Lachnospiraceae bacterium]MCI9470109.1 ANTAR domain-containing protein [Lachnospiraceae bacterium]